MITNEQIELLKARIQDPKFLYLNKEFFQKFLDGELKESTRIDLKELFKPNKNLMILDSFKENILLCQKPSIVINSEPVIKFRDLSSFEDNTSILERLEDNGHSLITIDQLDRVIIEHPFPRKYNTQAFESKSMFKSDGSKNLFFMKGRGESVYCAIIKYYDKLHKWYLSAEEFFGRGYSCGTRVFTS